MRKRVSPIWHQFFRLPNRGRSHRICFFQPSFSVSGLVGKEVAFTGAISPQCSAAGTFEALGGSAMGF
jgi:hypothetical protein